MSMTPELSAKLRALSFISIVIVVINHSCYLNAHHEGGDSGVPWLGWINYLISGTVGRCNRVLFFGISGYLFAVGSPFGKEVLFRKWSARRASLLIPYATVLCLYGLVTYCIVLFLPERVWKLSPTVASYHVATSQISSWLNVVMLRQTSPHLWFIEALLLAVFGLGAVFVATRWNRRVIVFLAVGLLLAAVMTGNRYLEGLSYFSFGVALLRSNLSLGRIRVSNVTLGFLALFWGVGVVSQMLLYLFSLLPLLLEIAKTVQSFIGAAVVFFLFDRFSRPVQERLVAAGKYTFPIYILHGPLIVGAAKYAWTCVAGRGEISLAMGIAPVAATSLSSALGCALLFRRFAPRFYQWVFGGRG